MKNLIITLIAFVCLSVNLSAQKQLVYSSNVIDEVNYMKYCMAKQHQQYNIGVGFFIGSGTTLAITGVTKVDKPVFYAASAVMAIIGTVIIFDSNKWIKRSSFGLSGKGMTVTYTFK